MPAACPRMSKRLSAVVPRRASCRLPGMKSALAATAFAALAGCSRPEPAPEPVRAVRTMTVGAETAAGSREFAAEIRARVESRLGFRVGGKMVSRSVEVGQHVAAGQVLARLDGTDLQLSQQASRAAVRAAQTSHDLAAAEYKRYKDLRDQGFIGALDLERREAALNAQKAQLEQALAQSGVQGNQAGYAALLAPAAGVVIAVEAEAGTVLASGTPVVRLAHDGARDAVFAVPEDGVQALRPLLARPGAIRVRPWGSATALPATVREIAAAADPATRTFQLKADLGAAALQLGQTVTVLVDLPRQEGVTKIPLAAVMQQQGRAAVWVLDAATMSVRVQPIAIGGADGNAVVVTGGLSPGQTVVTAGVHVLTPGQKVRYYSPPSAPLQPAPVSVPAAAGR